MSACFIWMTSWHVPESQLEERAESSGDEEATAPQQKPPKSHIEVQPAS